MKIDGNILLAECTTYDFKRELERQKKGKWLKSVSAFANTAGGKLFFGVDDDASIVGLENAQKDGEFISQATFLGLVTFVHIVKSQTYKFPVDYRYGR